MILKANDLLNDNRVQKEARSLIEAGHEVTVLAKKTSRSAFSEVVDGIKVVRIPSAFWDPRRFFLETAVALRADAYHGHDIYALDIAVVAAYRTGAFSVYDAHELWMAQLKHYWGIRFFRRLFYWMRERFLISKTDSVITVSRSIADILKKKYSLGDVVILRNVPPICDIPAEKDLRNLLPINDAHKVMVHVGGIAETRGIRYMVEAMSLDERLALVCIGAGLLEDAQTIEKLRRLAAKLGVEDRVHFVPSMPFDEMIAYVSSADFGMCLIQPANLSYYYSIANKFFEYLLAGIPVVASDLPEMRRLVEEYKVGITVPPTDAAALAHSLGELIDDSSTYDRMRHNTIRALEENNWALESKDLISLYDDISRRRPNAARRSSRNDHEAPSPQNILLLTSEKLTPETLNHLSTQYAGSKFTLVCIGPEREPPTDEHLEKYFPIRNVSDFIRTALAIRRIPIELCVTVYEKSNLIHLLAFDLLSLKPTRRKIACFPTIKLSYQISANIFLHKYLNRIETKLYFLWQFAMVLLPLRGKPSAGNENE